MTILPIKRSQFEEGMPKKSYLGIKFMISLGISIIISELNDFKGKIKNLDSHYKLLMNYIPKTLDHKLTTEYKYKKHISKLHSIHKKQKNIFVNISKLFVKHSLSSLKSLRKNK